MRTRAGQLRRRAPLAVALLTALLAAPAPAQEEEAPAAAPTETPAEVAPSAPEPFALAEVAVRSADTRRELQQIEKRLAPSPLVEGIARQVPPRELVVSNAARNVQAGLDSSTSLSNLDDLDREWTARDQDIDIWRDELAKRGNAIQKEQQRLAELRQRWLATRTAQMNAREERAAAERAAAEAAAAAAAAPQDPGAEPGEPAAPPAPPTPATPRAEQDADAAPTEATAEGPEPPEEDDPTLGWIEGALAAIDQTDETARERARAVIEIQGRVEQIQTTIDETLTDVRRARDLRRKRLFDPDAPPLWALRPHVYSPSQLTSVGDRLVRERATIRAYVELKGGIFTRQLVMMAVILAVAFALRRRLESWGEGDPDLGAAASALRHPFTVTLLAGLISSLWLHPLMPNALGDLTGTLLLIPALRLLPPLFDRASRPILYALAAFYLSSQVRELLEATPAIARLLFTLELVVALVLLALLIRPGRLARLEQPSRIPGYLGTAARGSLVILVAALLANLFGYLTFARILAGGLLTTLYGAAVLYGTYRIARVFVRVLLQTATARRLRMIRLGSAAIETWVGRSFKLVAFVTWLDLVLRSFAIRDPVSSAAMAALTTHLEMGTVSISLGDVATFVLTLFAAWLVSRFVRFVLEEDVFPRVVLQRGIPNAITTVVNYVILMLGFILALAAAGFELSRITLLAGAFGVGIGFGLQNVVNNFVSGLILLFERPIQVGDTIEVQGLLGDVRRIGPRSSTVRTFDGAEVIVPNGTLISDQVTNWTLSDRRRRVTVGVGVAYGTDPERVLQILRETAEEDETVLGDPAPLAVFMGFGDSSLNFELRCWIPRYEEGFTMRSALWVAINRKLAEAGIEIPFPQRDLHLRSVDGPARAALSELGAPGAETRGEPWPRAIRPGGKGPTSP